MAQNKLGRPPSDDSMKDRIFIRVDKETKAKLEECTKSLDATRSEVVRKGIDMVHDSLKK
jgi:predicted transcriptional regulator